MIVPSRIDISIIQGFPWDMTVEWTLDDVLAPLAGHSGFMQLRDADSPHVASTPGTTAGGQVVLTNPGQIQIVLSAGETADLELGLYEWDYVDVTELAVPNPVITGRCRVRLP